LNIGVGASGMSPQGVASALHAERLGLDCLWSAETWTFDAFTSLAPLAAATSRIALATGIAQLGARTPANLAMSSLSLQAMSRGRFRLGIGLSGPGVIEGWHGAAFDRPLQRLRETVEILRIVFAGERLDYHGEIYDIPPTGSDLRPLRTRLPAQHIPIYIASLGPRSLELTGELADGWLGNSFMPEQAEVYLDHIRRGAESAGRRIEDLDLVAPVAVEFDTSDEAAARRHADGYAFTIGAMGTADANFYNNAFARLGFGEAVEKVAALWARGKRDEAAAAVPIELGANTNLVGTPETIARRLALYRDTGITSLQAKIGGRADQRAETLDRLLLLTRDLQRRDG
jgi:F420-dependent oxidoreductase-like protein